MRYRLGRRNPTTARPRLAISRHRVTRSRSITMLASFIFVLATGYYGNLYLTNNTHAIGQVYTVTTTADSGPGSLRQAITDANANPTLLNGEPHNIQFNIPGTGVHTIALQTVLPNIARPTIIDGTTQAGSSCGTLVPDAPYQSNTPHTLMIEIVSSTQVTNGNEAVLNVLSNAPSTIKGLSIYGKKGTGATVAIPASNSLVECNYIGTRADGVTVTVASPVSGSIGISADTAQWPGINTRFLL